MEETQGFWQEFHRELRGLLLKKVKSAADAGDNSGTNASLWRNALIIFDSSSPPNASTTSW